MVVKKSLFKGKLLYWFILIVCLSLFLIPKYYYVTEPESFVHDELSEYEGKPVINCSVIKPTTMSSLTDAPKTEIYIRRNGTDCLIEKVPKTSYFSIEHPILYFIVIKWGNVIGIIAIIICLIPWRKKNESKTEKGKIAIKDREAENQDNS